MSAEATPVRAATTAGQAPPLCVDLDGTLLGCDLLFEAAVRFLKFNPLRLVRLVSWAFLGPARLKAELAAHVDLDVKTLPAHQEFIDWLHAQKREGRRLVICTAANERIAGKVAEHYGLFDEVIASSATSNFSQRAKAEHLVARYGKRGFDYAANETRDLLVWREARAAVVVAPPKVHKRVAEEPIHVARGFDVRAGKARDWLRALRLHQWAKNLLVFAPLAAAHRIGEPYAVLSCVLAFVLFGMCASGGYLVNDLLDLDADRAHPRKRTRPFAAGHLSLLHGAVAACALIGGSLALALLFLPLTFALALSAYLVTSLWYSLALKRIAMVDVLALAALYTVRIVAGGAAVGVVPSFWLLAFAMFLFLSLAAAKRFAELRATAQAGRHGAAGRGYAIDDLPLLQSTGLGAAYVSVLVLALYVNSGAATLYSRPQLMWLVCPVLLYWVNRVWLKTCRGQMHDDPVVFALTDRPSLYAFGLGAALAWAAV